MYNRYIGNTGKYVRVEDSPRQGQGSGSRRTNSSGPGPNSHGHSPNAHGPDTYANNPAPIQQHHAAGPELAAVPPQARSSSGRGKQSSLLGGLGGLKNLFGGLGSGLLGGGGHGGGLLGGGGGGGLKGVFEHLPFGLDIGDLLLLGVLLLFFMDSHDEEFLIILGFFIFSIYKDSKGPLESLAA